VNTLSHDLIYIAIRDGKIQDLVSQDWFKPLELEGDEDAEKILKKIRLYHRSHGDYPSLGDIGLSMADLNGGGQDSWEEAYSRINAFRKRAQRIELVQELASSLDLGVEAFDEKSDEFFEALAAIRRNEGQALWTSFADVEYSAVEWLWDKWIPFETMTVIAGDGGKGKSTWVTHLVGKATRGELTGTPESVLLINAEDSDSKVVKPRLLASEADMSKCYTIDLSQTTIEIPRSLNIIEQGINAFGAKLVVIDPLNSFLPENFDSYKDQSIRQALAPISLMAERTGAAIMWVLHTNKQGDIMGSKAFQNLARSVLVWGDMPDDETGDLRVLAHRKNNYEKRQPAMLFELESTVLRDADSKGRIVTSTKIHERGEVHVAAEDILRATASESITKGTRQPSIADKNRQAIIEAVRNLGEGAKLEAILHETRLSRPTCLGHLKFLEQEGKLIREGYPHVWRLDERSATNPFLQKRLERDRVGE
jgi:hypothetical protein